jgi:hypothetical protein
MSDATVSILIGELQENESARALAATNIKPPTTIDNTAAAPANSREGPIARETVTSTLTAATGNSCG